MEQQSNPHSVKESYVPEHLAPEVANRLGFHPATATTGPLHAQVRDAALVFADEISRLTPAGRHQSLALTAAQEAMMWASAAIAVDSVKE